MGKELKGALRIARRGRRHSNAPWFTSLRSDAPAARRAVLHCGRRVSRSRPAGHADEPHIFLQVEAELADFRWWAIVDTAAPWCVVVPAIQTHSDSARGTTALSTRLGVVRGEVHRVPLILFADEGRAITVDATVFASSDWRGPNFVGYQGFLERLRFAVDPDATVLLRQTVGAR